MSELSRESVEPLTPAEELLVEFCARDGAGDQRAFEHLCAEHAELAPELRTLRERWERLDKALGARVVVAGEGRHGPAGCFDAILARLTEHSPARPRYVADEELARGGMGIVFKVWDPDLRRHVAMKVLRRDSQRLGVIAARQRERMLGRFLEEAQITGQLEHPGIVPVHELGLDAEGRLYFTMPLVRGRELKEVIELAREGREGWNRTKALGVFLKVCEAVAYAHSKGVVHRDIKPSNVMVGRFGETYVMDWGLARVLGRDASARAHDDPESTQVETDVREHLESTPDSPLETAHGAVIGTPAYMAPEQALGRLDEIGPRSDVYAIGAMLYQLLTGQMPYVPNGAPISPHVVLAARVLGPPQSVLSIDPHAPPELAAICAKAMERHAERRYASALELAADIEAFLGHRPVKAFESTLVYVLKLAYLRNRKVFLVSAAATLLALAFGVREIVTTRSAVRVERELRGATQRLADFALGEQLVREVDELYPVNASRAPAMRRWIARVEDLGRRSDSYRSELAGGAASDDELAAHVEHLASLATLLPLVVERAARAETQLERTVEARRVQWDEAVASIASLPIYRGLRLTPQRGLVPLRLDPLSGLWQFWVDSTGTEPQLIGTRIAFAPHSALVVALIPGGRATLGWDITMSRADAIVDAQVGPDEAQHEVELAPYFIGITEVPQSVWERVMGSNPSLYKSVDEYGEAPCTPLLPVECVSWTDSRRFLARCELDFPTEAQWEFAARGGGEQAFGASEFPGALDGFENLNDWVASQHFDFVNDAWNDGYRLTAPIASYRANAFGLFDSAGNVAEWCRETYVEAPFEAALCGRDGAAPEQRSVSHAFRGASYYVGDTFWWRLAFRQRDQAHGANQTRGLRVVRTVE